MDQVGASHAFNLTPQISDCHWKNRSDYLDAWLRTDSRPSWTKEDTPPTTPRPLCSMGGRQDGLNKMLKEITLTKMQNSSFKYKSAKQFKMRLPLVLQAVGEGHRAVCAQVLCTP